MNEQEFRVLKRTGTRVEFVRHEGHSHFWTQNITEAMTYTKPQVAIALCQKLNGTEVVTTDGKTAWIKPV